jgi:hypothetical protein
MRPVWQTRRSDVDSNCFEACVASLLELDDVEAIPRYRDSNESMNRYVAEGLDPKLAERGLAVVALNALRHGNGGLPDYIGPDTCWIAFLDTGLPWRHAVVMRGSKVAHDPEGGSLQRLMQWPVATGVFLVARDGRGAAATARPS